MTSNSLFFKACSTAAFTLALAACGGGGSSSDTVQGANTNTGSPSQDSFFATVFAMVASSPDNAEPQEVDSIAATSPQNAEPSAMGS